MTSSYAVLASGGYKTPAYGITRITTLNGELVYEADPNAPRERILSETTVANMNQMMRAVVTGGTGTPRRRRGRARRRQVRHHLVLSRRLVLRLHRQLRRRRLVRQ